MANDPAQVVILARIPKARDLETHVREVDVDGTLVLELRDFIPSLSEYGRGYWFTREGAPALVDALEKV